MRSLIACLLCLVAVPAVAQNIPQQGANGARSTMLLWKGIVLRAQASNPSYIPYVAGARAGAVNANPMSSYISRGDALEAQANNDEPLAVAAITAAAARESQADMAYAAGNYFPAARLYGEARDLWIAADKAWIKVISGHQGAAVAYQMAGLRP